MTRLEYNDGVFINCPFDLDFKPIFDAIIFTVFDCGFIARCTMEEQDASQIRIEKIYTIISNCKYGIHDISRTELDPSTGFPRFNMAFELGIFLAGKRFGDAEQRKKKCLVLEKTSYKYQQFMSDISGQDIEAHENDSKKAVEIVRNWLRNASRRGSIPGGHEIWRHYQIFIDDLPSMCKDLRLKQNELIFNDYTSLVTEWLKLQE